MGWKKKSSAFHEQVLQMMTDEDRKYILQLGRKRAKDCADNEYNYCRTPRGTIELDEPEGLMSDISDEISTTIFDRFLFSGRITEGDYDDAIYSRPDALDGLRIYRTLAGHKLRVWRNEDAARRFVENDIEHDPAYFGVDDDVEIEDDDCERVSFGVSVSDILGAQGVENPDYDNMERTVVLAENSLNDSEKKEFVEFCDKEGQSVNVDNVFFWNDDAFCLFLRDSCVKLEKKAREKVFDMLSKKLGEQNGKKARKEMADLFALALYYKLTGHSVPVGKEKLGNMRLAK